MKFLVVLACALAVASAGHLVAPVATVYGGAQHLPVIGPNGVPIDTPEVQHARAAHLHHKVEAHARNGDLAVVSHAAPVVAAPAVATYAAAPAVTTYAAAPVAVAPAAYATTALHTSSYNGAPLETPEVVAAKANHFAAHADALARNGHYGVHHLIRRRRGIVAAPLAYSSYAAPVYSPYAYSSSYVASHSPVVAAYSHPYAYAAPYAHYY